MKILPHIVSKVAQLLLNQIVNKNNINVTVAAYVKMKEVKITKKG